MTPIGRSSQPGRNPRQKGGQPSVAPLSAQSHGDDESQQAVGGGLPAHPQLAAHLL